MRGNKVRALVLCRLIMGLFVLMVCMQAAVAMATVKFDVQTGRLEITDFAGGLAALNLDKVASLDKVLTLVVSEKDLSTSGFGALDFSFIMNNPGLPNLELLDLRGVDLEIDTVPQDALRDNKTLTTLYLPSSVKTIGQAAFRSCTNLAEVNFEDLGQLELIEQGAFRECPKLQVVNFEEMTALKTIEQEAFTSADLREITMPASLSTEGLDTKNTAFYKAFQGNLNLRRVDMSACVDFNPPVGTTSQKLAGATFNDPNEFLGTFYNVTEDLDSADTHKLAQEMFYNCPGIEEFLFPPKIKRIPRGFLGLDKELSPYSLSQKLSGTRAAPQNKPINKFFPNGAHQYSGKWLKNRNPGVSYIYSTPATSVAQEIKDEQNMTKKMLMAIDQGIFVFNIFGNIDEAVPPDVLHLVLPDEDWLNLIKAMMEFAVETQTFFNAVFPEEENVHYYNAKSLDVSPTTLEDKAMYVNDTYQYSGVEASYDDKPTDLPIFWTSSDPSVATVDDNGYVTALKVGTTTIEVAVWPHEDSNERVSAKGTITVYNPNTDPDPDPDPDPEVLPESVAELNVVVKIGDKAYTGVVQPDGSLLFTLPYGTDPSDATITYNLSDDITGTPASGSRVDLSKPLSIVVTDSSGNTKSFTINVQISEPENPDPDPVVLPESVVELNVALKIGDKEYKGIVQPDGSLLFTLPYGTDPSDATITYGLPNGITGTPASGSRVDLSKPLSIVVTDGKGNTKSFTIKVQITAPGVVETPFLDSDTSNWQVYLEWDEQGVLQVRVVIPVSYDLTTLPEMITIDIDGLDSIVLKFTFVFERARGSTEGYTLEVLGTAENRKALDSVLFKSISIWFHGDEREYRHTFGTGVRIADMKLMGEEGGSSGSSSGCNAGAFGATLLLCATLALLRSKGRR